MNFEDIKKLHQSGHDVCRGSKPYLIWNRHSCQEYFVVKKHIDRYNKQCEQQVSTPGLLLLTNFDDDDFEGTDWVTVDLKTHEIETQMDRIERKLDDLLNKQIIDIKYTHR